MHSKTITVTVLILTLYVTSPAATLQTEQVTFTGIVVDEQNRPVAGAKVTAYEMQFDGIAGNFDLHQTGEVITTKDGAFFFAAGKKPERSTFYECKIVAAKPGLALGWTAWKVREDAKSDIRLGASEKLEGMIVDSDGRPVAGANIRANLSGKFKTAEGEEKSEWLPGIEPLRELGAKTDSQGRFFFGNLPAEVGVDLLVTSAGKATTYTYQSEKKEPAFNAGQTDIKVTMPDESRIEGRILDPDTGEGIAGTKFAVVSCSSGLFYYRFVHTTSDDGTFKVGGLQSDKYLLRNGGFPHTYVEVESGKTAKITVQADRLSRPHGIPGVVSDPEGKPLPNAIISTYPPVTEELITDARGEFSLRSKRSRGQVEDIIYLLVRHKERNLAAAVELDESAKNLDITLVPGAILSGKVVDVEGKPIPSAELSLTFWTSSIGYRNSEVTEIDEAGHYEIRALPPGQKYSVNASADGYGSRYLQINTGDGAVEVDPLVLSVANLSASGIVVDGLDQPVSGLRIYAYGNGQPSRETFTDTKGRFTIENVCPGELSIQANSEAGSTWKFHGQAQAKGGATDIKIVVYELDQRGRRVPKQPPSLVGKVLPDLEELGIDVIPGDLAGKRMLVCFWEMNQRPSRNCIAQLAKQAEQLKNNGVTVITVQASKIDREVLNQWVEKNNIPFPVGIVQGDAEKVCFAWGVQSLPWLILTLNDSRHIVTSEGFRLADLNDKIKAVK